MREKVNIGFDIGITSVGWAIVKENNEIVARGVRLFEELKNEKDGKLANQERRSKRTLRRVVRRKQNRKNDFIKLIYYKYNDIFKLMDDSQLQEQLNSVTNSSEKFKIIRNDFLLKIASNPKYQNQDTNPLLIKIKALKEVVEKNELLKILYHYLSHRGYTYLDAEKYESKVLHPKIINSNYELKEFAEFYKRKAYINDRDANNSTINKDSLVPEKNESHQENVSVLENNWKYDKNFEKANEKEIKEHADKINWKIKGFKKYDSFCSAIKNFIENYKYFEKFPSQIQYEKYIKNKEYRGFEDIKDLFFIQDWNKEIKKVLFNQTYLTEEFKNDFLYSKTSLDDIDKSIFSRTRNYSEGPGKGSKYGLLIKNSTGDFIKKDENLWDKLLGKCSVYPNEFRADEKSCSQEIANILSQLNMLVIKNDSRTDIYLSKEEKETIIFESLKLNKPINLKQICNVIKCTLNDIYHYPTDLKKESNKEFKEKFEEMVNSRSLFNIFKEAKQIDNFDKFLDMRKLFNDIINVFSKYPSNSLKQKSVLSVSPFNFDSDTINEILLSKINGTKTSSMSLKALNQYINDEFKNKGLTINQKFKRIIEKNEELNFEKLLNSKYINENALDEDILSPTTKCSFREALKVFNGILKQYIYNAKFAIKNIVLGNSFSKCSIRWFLPLKAIVVLLNG